MAAAPTDARRLTFENLDALWNAGQPQALPLAGAPWCEIVLDPIAKLVTLRTDYQQPEPDLSSMRSIELSTLAHDGRDLAEIRVRVRRNVQTVYGLLASIADELQVAKASLASAVSTAIRGYRDVLSARVAMSTEQEIGLVGELLFLEFLVGALGGGVAVGAWMGPASEEHDFAFPDIHIEVKTTASERRTHVINGLSQLVPVGGVPLSLLSMQVTRANSDAGRSLPALIDAVRAAAGGYVVAIDQVLRESFGWEDDDADLYPTAWLLRSTPRAYAVDAGFPAITPSVIQSVVPNFGLLSDVAYKVDVTGLDAGSLPEQLAGFVESQVEP
ncbi:MAG: PD-(D/E)XK motif protein [Nocardioides sp.]